MMFEMPNTPYMFRFKRDSEHPDSKGKLDAVTWVPKRSLKAPCFQNAPKLSFKPRSNLATFPTSSISVAEPTASAAGFSLLACTSSTSAASAGTASAVLGALAWNFRDEPSCLGSKSFAPKMFVEIDLNPNLQNLSYLTDMEGDSINVHGPCIVGLRLLWCLRCRTHHTCLDSNATLNIPTQRANLMLSHGFPKGHLRRPTSKMLQSYPSNPAAIWPLSPPPQFLWPSPQLQLLEASPCWLAHLPHQLLQLEQLRQFWEPWPETSATSQFVWEVNPLHQRCL